ncbi:DUF397 domain-containing protein [Streptomyces acidiscabies]|uniref:DUF397 domain-containing protein n=1 Tax=Streptomyces acidiscabies TaxID=42234 RepID=A0ABU4MAH3_9ACTN|nr:DUF397 domain-containing protein [Streptomyces acidiscabies]MDX3024918.1 DUF397 domain-containing protein [Streptomyces acidiscabies]
MTAKDETTRTLAAAVWRTSTYSDGGQQCVEVATNLPDVVPVRDSKKRELRFPRDAECVGRGSDGSHERNIDHGCPQKVLAGVA